MKLINLAKNLGNKFYKIPFAMQKNTVDKYQPTPYLAHPFLQSVYNISQPLFRFEFQREKIFLEDGGHISLDWLPSQSTVKNPPILFVMHGLTGGSQMNYIKQLVRPASQEGYCCVCLNSRGINNEMTSPIPFTGMSFTQLQTALTRVSVYYENSPIYLVGTSFGGNYLMRYLIRQKHNYNIKGLVVLAPPIDVTKTVQEMGSIYQKFFVKRYIEQTVSKHKQMEFWGDIGLVNMEQVRKAQNLMEFHTSLTSKIIGYSSAKEIFDEYTINEQELNSLNVQTLMMLSKDDPIVSFKSMPIESIMKNPKINLQITERGGHLCWFQGMLPKRWYPKPVLKYIKQLRTRADQLL